MARTGDPVARILIAWELGGEHGHVEAFAPLALALRAGGHEVVFALRELARAEHLLARHGFTVLQAPVWPQLLAGGPPAGNHAELLFRMGYLDGEGITGLARGWRALIDLLRPDVLVAHYAPTAVLAARGTPVAVVGLGTGFHLPPAAGRLPDLLPPGAAPPARLAAAERRACDSANTAMQRLGGPALQRAGELFAARRTLLCTFAETDVFRALRRDGDAQYFGPRLSWSTAHRPPWPPAPGRKRVFVYLKGRYRETPAVLAALHALEHAVIGYVPGLAAQHAASLRSDRMVLSATPVSLRHVANDCDLVICNSGHGTCGGALLMGRALLLIPAHVEQACNARVLRQQGLAHVIDPSSPSPDLRAVLSAALDDRALHERCVAFAAAHADFGEQRQIEALAQAIASCPR